MTRIDRPQARQTLRQNPAVDNADKVSATSTAEVSPAPAEAGAPTASPDAIDAGVAGDFAATQGMPRAGTSPLNLRIAAATRDPMDLDGDGLTSQAEMNQSAGNSAADAGTRMNAALGKALDAFSYDAELGPELKAAQASFDSFADAYALLSGNAEARGGSMMPMIYAGTKTRLADKRAAVLEKAAAEGYFPYHGTANTSNAASQLEMNQAAYASYEKADKELSTLVAQLKTKLGEWDPESVGELAKAEAAFADFRDKQAEVAGNAEARGGSMFGLIYASAKEGITREHIEQLKADFGHALEGADPMDLDGNGITSQMEMNIAARDGREQAKAAMDNALLDVGDKFTHDPELGPELRAAQKAFESFVDADALFYGNANARGGSMMPMLFSGHQHKLFEDRTAILEKTADDGYFPYYGTADTSSANNQLEMNQAAYASYEQVQAKLDVAVGKLRAKMADWDPESAAELDKAQAAYGEFAKLQAEVAGNAEARGGSMFGLIYASALEGLTQARLDQVNAYLEEFSG